MAAMPARKIYNDYIKPLPPNERLELLALLAEDAAQQARHEPAQTHSIMELHGLGKEIWEGVDVQEYADELRRDWEQRTDW